MPVALVPQRDRVERVYSVGFIIGSYPTPRQIELAARTAWDKFLVVQEKRGWHVLSGYRPVLNGPEPYIEPINLPKYSAQDKFHPSKFVTMVPRLDECDSWLYTLEGHFWVDAKKVEVLVTGEGELPVDYSAQIRKEIAASGVKG